MASGSDSRISRARRLAGLIAAMVLAAGGCGTRTAGTGTPSVAVPEAPPAAGEQAAKAGPATKAAEASFAGSASCVDCHQRFHELWATSRHGLAMQPYTAEFARKELTAQAQPVVIGGKPYRAEIGHGKGVVREGDGPGAKDLPIAHVLGGKNAYYFLTPMDRGRLQVLPVAYDVNKRSWYDTAASGVRHFPDRTDAALHWTDRMFTFNTTCFNCHVSQLATNYDLGTDTYRTTWAEAGISCESCHGPAAEHVRVMTHEKPAGRTSKDLKIIRTKEFSPSQMNDMCATCHAKMVPLSTSFAPGDAFFDHYDLVTLENPDYYPDGRDLGENYTYTSWLSSPCAKAGKLDCNHCHTGSGRPRFSMAESDKSCLPCHQKLVDDPAPHGHHAKGSEGNRCVSCHMPTTRFAAMGRTDHSMRPPTPATTLAFKSPNACNLCHKDRDAAWADKVVREWYSRDYQAPVLASARLLDDARHDRWGGLPAMLAAAVDPAADSVWKASMLSALHGAPGDPSARAGTFLKALDDPSPLVRSRAASGLTNLLSQETATALLKASRDPSRLVRIRAAQSLAAVPDGAIADRSDRAAREAAVGEFLASMGARPDDWASHANVGNFEMERGAFDRAAREFEVAARIEPRAVGPLVNASLAYSNLQQPDRAEAALRRALEAEPGNASALFNLGLLQAETGRPADAEKSLRAAIGRDPHLAAAAYNLGVLAASRDKAEAVRWCRKALDIEPTSTKYAHALAFYQQDAGDLPAAAKTLGDWLSSHPADADAIAALGSLHERRGDRAAAARLYREASANPAIPAEVRSSMAAELRRLQP
ncbi:ammonia-forming cytochrome c nitrite reductase subunit c552 [Aquisphaera giovannonii]|uniref:ammonia-forming cytochrome c nitrite reductase subunit c552 n=1 Tax=Aquisphaera giovannonii TaxID=406548 RepID=UPI0011DFC7C0|nr:tetratricopeptide repeat protein [Aquisphaera giovannonii]